MFDKIVELGVNILSTRLTEITRQEVTSFFKILLIILTVVVLQNLLIRLVLLIQKVKSKQSMTLAISSAITEVTFFLTMPTLVMLIIFLATMDKSVAIKDYSIVLILIYFFSALLSLGMSLLMKKTRFKKKSQKSKKGNLNLHSFKLILIISHIVIYILALILFPKEYKWFALLYVLNSLIINGIALLVSSFKESKEPIKKSKKKSENRKKSSKKKSNKSRKKHKLPRKS